MKKNYILTIINNFIPLVGVFFLKWDIFGIILYYWLGLIIVFAINIFFINKLGGTKLLNEKLRVSLKSKGDRKRPPAFQSYVVVGICYNVIVALFIWYLFEKYSVNFWQLMQAGIIIILSSGLSHYLEIGKYDVNISQEDLFRILGEQIRMFIVFYTAVGFSWAIMDYVTRPLLVYLSIVVTKTIIELFTSKWISKNGLNYYRGLVYGFGIKTELIKNQNISKESVVP